MILIIIAIFLLFPPVKRRKGIMTIAPPIEINIHEFPYKMRKALLISTK